MNETKSMACFLCFFTTIILIAGCTGLPDPGPVIHEPCIAKDWGKAQPAPADMACHMLKEPHPFEWWYIDGHLDNGITFVGVFHLPSFVSGKPTVTFTLYWPDGRRTDYVRHFDQDEIKASCSDLNIETPAGFLKRLNSTTFHAVWRMDDVEADFVLTTEAPGWKPIEKSQTRKNSSSAGFWWVIHQAKNRIKGTLTVGGKKENVSGTGYADHNWGIKPLHEITKKWVWGRILAGDFTIIYADVEYRDSSVVSRPLYIAYKDRMILGTGGPEIRQLKFIMDPIQKRYYPSVVEIRHAGEDVSANIRIKMHKLMESVDLLEVAGYSLPLRWFIRTFIARPCYFRLMGVYDGEIFMDGRKNTIKGECIYEVMNFE